MPFDYFYGREDAEQYLFYRIPKALITGEQFRDISCESKLLYGLMLDRLSLSMKNGWFDDLNRAYIVYTVEDIMSDLQCGNQKAGKLLQELEQKAELIKRKSQGLGKSSKYAYMAANTRKGIRRAVTLSPVKHALSNQKLEAWGYPSVSYYFELKHKPAVQLKFAF